MRKLANLFLLLFIATAIATITNELLHLFLDLKLLDGIQQLIWLSCIGIGTIVYLGMGFNQHLPKTILIPIFIWLCWSLLDYWPLENSVGSYFRLFASCGQLLLGIVILKLNRQSNQKYLFLTPSQFAGTPFSGRNLFFFCLISIPVVPMALLLASYAIVGALIEDTTAGFVQLKPNGLYMSERIYQQNNKQVRLAGMIHLAQESFYTDLTASIPDTRTIILTEGVSDKDNLLAKQFGYQKIAGLLGLTSQEQVHFRGRPIAAIDPANVSTTEPNLPDLLRADIDLNQFDPQTLAVLNALATHVLNSNSLTEGYREFNRWTQEHTTPDLNKIIMNDLIFQRNQAVIGYLLQALHQYDTVVIPWGALHLKGIETVVLNSGFVLAESRERLSIDFRQLPYSQLWRRLDGKKE